MIDTVLAFLAPHHCCSCGKVGSLLCNDCKYDIVSDPSTICIVCKKPAGERGICKDCRPHYERAWTVAERTGPLEQLIDLYKFERAKAAYYPITDLLHTRLPELPEGTVIVPIPTIAPHIRERGYDHTLLIARELARQRGLPLAKHLLVRRTTTSQRGASKLVRKKQAEQAFVLSGTVDPSITYLLVDDIVTTGATLDAAAKLLKDAGAKDVWVAVVAYQTLD
jgi:ComF family protein